jgi:hypothetical protein
MAMNAAERLHKKYQKDLRHLQQTCRHKKLTDWIEEWWAPGHSTGRRVKVCTSCNKVMQAQRACRVCSSWHLEDELKEGDGQVLPLGSWYCETCHTAEDARAPGRQERYG